MQESADRRILIIGAGPAGLLAALALGREGFAVSLIGPDMKGVDRRTTALMAPALDYLETLGLDPTFAGNAAPLASMRILDGTTRLIRSPTVTFHAKELGFPAFGSNIPNSVLNAALEDALAKYENVERIFGTARDITLADDHVQVVLDDGRDVTGALIIAADGRDSPAREAAGIRTIGHPYPQSALVLSFDHTRPHNATSNEFHMESGPFTQVPLPGLASSLVWVVTPKMAEELIALDDEAISRKIEARMGSMLGAVTMRPNRQVFPLMARMPLRFARNRVVLVGEAAHVVPPIGAQGLNLGVRDVRAITEILRDHRNDPGSDAVLSRYDRERRPDIMARQTAVNMLNRSLLSDFLPAQIARNLGLNLLERLSPLRRFFMNEGMAPGAGFRDLNLIRSREKQVDDAA